MAVAAGESCMPALEREVRADVVVEHRGGPAVAGMTACAVVAECPLMDVVFRMAARALTVSIEEAVALVTAATRYGGMQAGQRENRQVMIEADGREPGRLGMAARALGLHLSAVRVIHCVTARTGFLDVPGLAGLVAGRAGEEFVRFFEPESRLGVVELALVPQCRHVTGTTVRTVATLVVVFRFVAIDTAVGKRVLVILASVAVGAREIGMTVSQREAGFLEVLEADRSPGRC